MLQIGEIIKQAREKKGLSQEDVASAIGVKRSTYAEWEGKTEPKASIFMKIAETLGINPIDVFSSYVFPTQERQVIAKKIDELQSSLDDLKGILLSDTETLGSKRAAADADEKVSGEHIPEKGHDADKLDK